MFSVSRRTTEATRSGEACCSHARDAYNAGMQYTLRNIPKRVDKAIRARAKAEGKSVNSVAIELWERALGLNGEEKVYHDMQDLFGAGALEPEVLRAIAKHDVVHPDDFK